MPTLAKTDRLCSENLISNLFAQGKRIRIAEKRYLLRVLVSCTLISPSSQILSPTKTLFSAPKSSFKRAVHRNRIKRLLRESFRSYKPYLESSVPNGYQIHLALIFTQQGKTVSPSDWTLELLSPMLEKGLSLVQKNLVRHEN